MMLRGISRDITLARHDQSNVENTAYINARTPKSSFFVCLLPW